jgi:predicted nucleic acid-binding protein
VVPLLVEAAPSRGCRDLVRADPTMVVWAFTRTEALSALQRQHRAGILDDEALAQAEDRLRRIARRWSEVNDLHLVREQAERMLRVHRLRAADALQLGAALVAVELRPNRRPFVVLDDLLLDAASREGFEGIRPRG